MTRIAFLSYSSGEFDARTFRMARSAAAIGYEVRVYARWEPGLPRTEIVEGVEVVRAPWHWRMAIPVIGARWVAQAEAAAARTGRDRRATPRQPSRLGAWVASPRPRPLPARLLASGLRVLRDWWQVVVKFPLQPLAWRNALVRIAEPADIWHGMWAGSLPSMAALRRRHGGRTIYDSRDVYLLSRNLVTAPGPIRRVLARLERGWATSADRVITVNEAYATLIAGQLGIAPPAVVMNCPAAWDPPTERPSLIRDALGLAVSVRIVLYQGQLISDRGIEQAMDAILAVPDATLVLLGYGPWQERYREAANRPPYLGRVRLLPAVAPSELLRWTASADLTVMPIQPTSPNHRFTTPQKLFESIAAGVPVVASDLPGMAEVVRAIDAGVLCDPTSATAIADAIRRLLDEAPAARSARRDRILAAAHDRYNWEAQVGRLLGMYAELAGDERPRSTEPGPTA